MPRVIQQGITLPRLHISKHNGTKTIELSGDWNLHGIALATGLRKKVKRLGKEKQLAWNLEPVKQLDSAGALYYPNKKDKINFKLLQYSKR